MQSDILANFLDPTLKKFMPGLKVVDEIHSVAPGFKNKTRYTPYVSPGSQILHIVINKGNINRQSSIYNVLSIKNITLGSKQ